MPPHSRSKTTAPPPAFGHAQPVLDLMLAVVAPIPVIARGWRTMGLGYAYCVHVFGVALWFILYTMIEAVTNNYYGRGSDPLVVEITEDLASAHPDELLLMLLAIAVFAIMIESGFLVLAWVLMPWGASPEPWRRSMNRGLIRLLQLTPFFAVSMVLLIAGMEWIDNLNTSYYSSRGRYNTRQSVSWETRQLLFSLLWCVYLVSQFGTMLWAMTIHTQRPGWAAHCPWPAECEGCGYQLVGMSSGQTCPECGKLVDHSFHSPRATPDDRGLAEKMLQATFRPLAFGRTIPLYRPDNGHRKAIGLGAALLILTAPVGMVLAWIIVSIGEGNVSLQDFNDSDDLLMMFSILSMITSFTLVGAVLLGLLGATLWGAYARLFRRRNALYPAAQTFGYQSGFFALWALGAYPVIAIVVQIMENSYSHSYGGHHYQPPPVWVNFLPLIVVAYHLLMALVGFILQGLMLRGARHGNG